MLNHFTINNHDIMQKVIVLITDAFTADMALRFVKPSTFFPIEKIISPTAESNHTIKEIINILHIIKEKSNAMLLYF